VHPPYLSSSKIKKKHKIFLFTRTRTLFKWKKAQNNQAVGPVKSYCLYNGKLKVDDEVFKLPFNTWYCFFHHSESSVVVSSVPLTPPIPFVDNFFVFLIDVKINTIKFFLLPSLCVGPVSVAPLLAAQPKRDFF